MIKNTLFFVVMFWWGIFVIASSVFEALTRISPAGSFNNIQSSLVKKVKPYPGGIQKSPRWKRSG